MTAKAVNLLKKLVATPSLSREEDATATILFDFLEGEGVEARRVGNNVWALAAPYKAEIPTLMLNSHHDTVKPSPAYSFDPFAPFIRDEQLYGLGSNDAGGPLVSLVGAFLELKDKELPFNLLLALTAEEEVSGQGGMSAFLTEMERLGINISCAIVGEPTSMEAALGERGLVVLDCEARGISGHAARNEGVNAIYKAVGDIEKLRNMRFEKESELLGPVKISVTVVEGGRQHNVVPDSCRFVVDVRTTDAYSNEETVEKISRTLSSEVKPRSLRLRASAINATHPLVEAVNALEIPTFISPTMSDMALLRDIPSIKIGPGDSARSHTADEFIGIHEIDDAIAVYIKLISSLSL